MNPEEIKKELQQKPFVPIIIHLSDGQSFRIEHPELVLLTKRALYFTEKEFENPIVISYMHITHITGASSAA